MRYGLGTRILALLLAAAFFAGQTGTSDLDALLFHSGRVRQVAAAAAHVESGHAANQDHADHCMLGFRLANGQLLSSPPVTVRFGGAPLRPGNPGPAAQPPASPTGPQQRSRAPPFVLA